MKKRIKKEEIHQYFSPERDPNKWIGSLLSAHLEAYRSGEIPLENLLLDASAMLSKAFVAVEDRRAFMGDLVLRALEARPFKPKRHTASWVIDAAKNIAKKINQNVEGYVVNRAAAEHKISAYKQASMMLMKDFGLEVSASAIERASRPKKKNVRTSSKLSGR